MFDFTLGFACGVIGGPAFLKYAWPRIRTGAAALLAKVW